MDTTPAVISGFLGVAAGDLTDERKADLARVAGRIGSGRSNPRREQE